MNRIFKLIASSFMTALLLAASARAGDAPSSSGSYIPFWRLGPITNSGLLEPMERVVRQQDEFARLWSTVWVNYLRQPELPVVDFSKEVVVVVGLGQRSTGGYSVYTQHITDVGEFIEISYVTTVPGSGVVTTSLTSPVEILRLALPSKPVKFVVEARTTKAGCLSRDRSC